MARESEVIAENVRSLRVSKHLSQKALAELCDLPQPRIAEIERGEIDSRVSTVAKVAKALGISTAALLIPLEPN